MAWPMIAEVADSQVGTTRSLMLVACPGRVHFSNDEAAAPQFKGNEEQ